MRLLFLLICASLCAVDFDCVVVGTSPFSLFEALYQYHSGKRVLIIEESGQCGGAWKAISVCGIEHADLGCHQIGHDVKLKEFLENYAGCNIVSLDNPLVPYDGRNSPNGFYFSKGCYELIDHLETMIEETEIVVLLGHKMESVTVDPSRQFATVVTKDRSYTTSKIIATLCSQINLDAAAPPSRFSKYYHLYVLIQDPTAPRFTYREGHIFQGVNRVMNLTHFVGLAGTGQQLLVVQTNGEQLFSSAQQIIDTLKKQNLLDGSAYVLKWEPFIYEAGYCNQHVLSQKGFGNLFEFMETRNIGNLSRYVQKWQTTIKPYRAKS